MNPIRILSRLAILGVVATGAGLALNALALTLFATAASTLVLLIMVGDYARRPSYAATALALASRRRAERMALAA